MARTRSLVAFLVVALSAFTAPAARAQIDLPQKPVPAPGSKPVDVPPAPRGNLAKKVVPEAAGRGPDKGGAPPIDLPEQEPSGGAPASGAAAATSAATASTAASASAADDGAPPATPQQRGAASFVFSELARTSADARLLDAAVERLARLGGAGLEAARRELEGQSPAALLVASRVLLAHGNAGDAELVIERAKGRLPAAACGPLIDALAEVDPVRAPPRVMLDLLSHPQAGVRAAAQRRLAGVPPAELLAVLPEAFASRSADARARAVQLLAGMRESGALTLLVRALADPSAEVARRAAQSLGASDDPSVPGELLRAAFNGRWILRENAYALLALADLEDRTLTPALGASYVDPLLGGLSSAEPFVAGACAVALAGIGFHTGNSASTPWLDREVPERLVRAVSGAEFFSDFGALQAVALRRLETLSGQTRGTDGPAWVTWWTGASRGFRARRAVLDAEPEDAQRLVVHGLLNGALGAPREFVLLGPGAPDANGSSAADTPTTEDVAAGDGAARSAPDVDLERARPAANVLLLSPAQAGELFEVLRVEGLFAAQRLPGTRGVDAARASRTLEVSIGSASKVFRFLGSASEPWFESALASVESLCERNRWQRYAAPRPAGDRRAALASEAAWWDGEHSELERDLRLKQLVLQDLPARALSERDPGVAELVRLSRAPGRIASEDFAGLLELLGQENFFAERAQRLLALTRAAARAGGALEAARAQRVIDVLAATFAGNAARPIGELLDELGAPASRAAASDERHLVRAVAALCLARTGDPESLPLLAALLRDPVSDVVAAAYLAVGEGRVQALATDVAIAARTAQAPAVRAAALQALGRLGGEGALDALVVGLSERESPQVSEAAARGLVALADPTTGPLFVSMLGRTSNPALVQAGRQGCLTLGERVRPDLERVLAAPESPARREAALILSRMGVPQAVPVLIALLGAAPGDARVAGELAVISGLDASKERDPAAAWLAWWQDVVHDEPLRWMLGGLERAGQATVAVASLSGAGTSEGATFLVHVLSSSPGEMPPHLVERARRELARLLGREIAAPPLEEDARQVWLGELKAAAAARYN